MHVRIEGNPNQRYPLLFRDYLRLHPATAALYEELKRRLAGQIDVGLAGQLDVGLAVRHLDLRNLF